MKKHLPFLLGLFLGPVGVLISWVALGRETFLASIKGVGIGCCVVCVLMLARTDDTPTTQESDDTPPRSRVEETKVAESDSAHTEAREERSVQPEPVVETEPIEQAQETTDPAVLESDDKLSRLCNAALKYREIKCVFPKSLDELRTVKTGAAPLPVRDAWGRRFAYECDGKEFAFASSGPDRIFDTDDDIVRYWDDVPTR